MKRALFFLVSVIVLSAALPACRAGSVTSPVSSSAAGKPSASTGQSTFSPTASANIDYAALGMSSQQVQQWQQQGTVSVDTPDAASVLAGFNVITPSDIPSSLVPGSKYTVTTNAPLLQKSHSDAPPQVHVEEVWSVPGQSAAVVFIQSNLPFDHGDEVPTPTQMCGITVQTGTNSENQGGAMAGGQFFHWEQNGTTCDLTGIVSSALSETDLKNLVCSIINP